MGHIRLARVDVRPAHQYPWCVHLAKGPAIDGDGEVEHAPFSFLAVCPGKIPGRGVQLGSNCDTFGGHWNNMDIRGSEPIWTYICFCRFSSTLNRVDGSIVNLWDCFRDGGQSTCQKWDRDVANLLRLLGILRDGCEDAAGGFYLQTPHLLVNTVRLLNDSRKPWSRSGSSSGSLVESRPVSVSRHSAIVFDDLGVQSIPQAGNSNRARRRCRLINDELPDILKTSETLIMTFITRGLGTTIIGYQVRLIGRVNLLVAFLISILLPLVMFLPDNPNAEYRVFWALIIVEQFTPLLGIAICSDILSTEWEKQTADIWLAKSYPRSRVVLSRFIVAVVLTILSVLLITSQFYLTYVRFDWIEMLLVAIPGAIFLGTMGMLAGTALKNSAAAYIIPLAYWAFEMSTKGKYTGEIYIFARTGIICHDAEDICMAMAQSDPWFISKLLILAITTCLLGITALLLQRTGRKWI